MHIGAYIREARRLAKEAQGDPNVTPNNLVLRNLAIPFYIARDVISKTRSDYRSHIFEELVAVGNFATPRTLLRFLIPVAAGAENSAPGKFLPPWRRLMCPVLDTCATAQVFDFENLPRGVTFVPVTRGPTCPISAQRRAGT